VIATELTRSQALTAADASFCLKSSLQDGGSRPTLGQAFEVAKRLKPKAHRCGRQPSAGQGPARQPDHFLGAIQDFEIAMPQLRGDHVNRIGADVDGRDPHSVGGALDSIGGAHPVACHRTIQPGWDRDQHALAGSRPRACPGFANKHSRRRRRGLNKR
jgi:hypothetical protein